MNKYISFPHLGDYSHFVKPLIENVTNLKVNIAPPITKKTLEIGSMHSPDFICLPFKYNMGNYIEALESGNTILFQFGGGCRYGNYAEAQKTILKDLGYKFQFYEFINKGKTSFNKIYKMFKEINPNLKRRTLFKELVLIFIKIMLFDKLENYSRKKIEVVPNSFKKLKYEYINSIKCEKNIIKIIKKTIKYKRKIKKVKTKKPKIKIGIIGELYTAMEPFSTYNLEDELKKYDISIKRFTNVSYLLIYKKLLRPFIKFKTRKYLKYKLGADASDNVYRMLYLKKHKYDGIIHTKPFGCTPEVGVIPILNKISKEENIPLLCLSFDTGTIDTGIKTRIEAFNDMLLIRKENKK